MNAMNQEQKDRNELLCSIREEYLRIVGMKNTGSRKRPEVEMRYALVNALCRFCSDTEAAWVWGIDRTTVIHGKRNHEMYFINSPFYRVSYRAANELVEDQADALMHYAPNTVRPELGRMKLSGKRRFEEELMYLQDSIDKINDKIDKLILKRKEIKHQLSVMKRKTYKNIIKDKKVL